MMMAPSQPALFLASLAPCVLQLALRLSAGKSLSLQSIHVDTWCQAWLLYVPKSALPRDHRRGVHLKLAKSTNQGLYVQVLRPAFRGQ